MLSNQVLMHGLVYSGGFALIILISVLINPRIWLQDFPEHLKHKIPPKSGREVYQTFITGFLFAMFILGFPLYSLSVLMKETVEALSFTTLFLHSFSVMIICNILYWFFFDLLIFNLIISRIRTVPGLKKKFKFSGWRRQVFGMAVGILSCVLITGFVATIALLFQK
jgi:hypothetical protein